MALRIDLNKPPVVLLTGNGICQCLGEESCDDLIAQIGRKEQPDLDSHILNQLPFPMRIVVASRDQVDVYMKEISARMIQDLLLPEDRAFMRQICGADADAVLTVNYSYETEHTLIPGYSYYQYRKHVHRAGVGGRGRGSGDQDGLFDLYRYTDLSEEGITAPLWHIHGEAYRPRSIVMGHYFYGEVLRQIENYVPRFLARYRSQMRIGAPFLLAHSWVDYFLLGDIHIVGCGMSLSEEDLWWLVCCKKKFFPDRKIHFYNPEISRKDPTRKALLMDAYGVDIVCPEHFDGNYRQYYVELVQGISNQRHQ